MRDPLTLRILGLLLLAAGAGLLRRRRAVVEDVLAGAPVDATVVDLAAQRPDVSGLLPGPRSEARTEVSDRR